MRVWQLLLQKSVTHAEMEDSETLPFSKRLLCPQLIKATKQSQPLSQFQGCFLCA